jgi:GNAT superfamily N-acetyltransferase
MLIREATQADVTAIAKVHVDTWRSNYQGIVPDAHLAQLSYERRARGWQQILEHAAEDNTFTLVAESACGEVIGFANAGADRSHDPIYQGELNALYILQTHQRQGVGRQLVRAVSDRLTHMGFTSMQVWVLAANPACKFYAALGGQRLQEQEIVIGGKSLVEVAYGWLDTAHLKTS